MTPVAPGIRSTSQSARGRRKKKSPVPHTIVVGTSQALRAGRIGASRVNEVKSCPASEAPVWDTVEPAVSQDVSGSREGRGSGPPGM